MLSVSLLFGKIRELNYEPNNYNIIIKNSNINNIIEYAIENNIYKFDVTSMENIGGCSITINDKSKLNSNLTFTRSFHK